jgi:restriction system protein
VISDAVRPTTPHVHPLELVESLFHALLLLWPLWLIVLASGLLRLFAVLLKQRRLRRSGILDIDAMTGHAFERRLEVLFRGLGYDAKVVGSSAGDFGGDLVVTKGRKRTVVQAKCQRRNVGNKAVQEAAAARDYYDAGAAIVVTNRYFTSAAKEQAKKSRVGLWDRDRLVAALRQAQQTSRPIPEATASVDRLQLHSLCARCGEPVSDRVREYCAVHPVRFRGLVYCYEHQRSLA